MKIGAILGFAAFLTACGNNPPAATPATAETTAETLEKQPAPEPKVEAPTPPAESAPPMATSSVPDPVAEKCEGNWVCLKVSFATRKVEQRETKLLGDPKIESTWSTQSDGRAGTFQQFSKGPVELLFKRLPNDNNEVTVRIVGKGQAISIDKHAGNLTEVTHVGAIATEDQDGNLLIDLSYQH